MYSSQAQDRPSVYPKRNNAADRVLNRKRRTLFVRPIFDIYGRDLNLVHRKCSLLFIRAMGKIPRRLGFPNQRRQDEQHLFLNVLAAHWAEEVTFYHLRFY